MAVYALAPAMVDAREMASSSSSPASTVSANANAFERDGKALDAKHRAVVKIQTSIRRYIRRKRAARAPMDATEVVMDEVRGKTLKCALLALAWFSFSTGLALFNKQVFGQKRGGFPAPLFLTSMQFAFQFVFAKIAIGAGVIESAEREHGRREEVPYDVYWRALAPVGATMGLDIALSNLSLVFISVSFYTVVKTSSIIFTLLLAFWFRFERPSWYLFAVVAVVSVGQIMSVEGESSFNVSGFFICLTAAFMSGLRWTLSQRVMHRNPDDPGDSAPGIKESHILEHPVVFVYQVMPVMCSVVFVFSCIKERWWISIPRSDWLNGPIDLLIDIVVVGCGATMAFLLTLSEFELLRETSALTIMMIGVVKDIVAIILSMVVFGDKFGMDNVLGLSLCLMGVVGYNKYKIEAMKIRALTQQNRRNRHDDVVPLMDINAYA